MTTPTTKPTQNHKRKRAMRKKFIIQKTPNKSAKGTGGKNFMIRKNKLIEKVIFNFLNGDCDALIDAVHEILNAYKPIDSPSPLLRIIITHSCEVNPDENRLVDIILKIQCLLFKGRQ